MTTNKNQHFVPRCHLKPFTLNGENAAISLFNLDRKKLIENAPVKNQCSRDYFYGTNEKLESAIQTTESAYGQALQDVIKNNKLFTDANKDVFKIFWLFQHLRTEAAAMRTVEMSESTRVLADIPPEEFSLGIKEAVQMACRTFVDAINVIDDLKFCLLKNKTNSPFITSDNPAILTNKWRLDKDKHPSHSFGLGSAGALILLPLTPKLLFLGYDGDVYSVPHKDGIVELKSQRDIIALNRHQFLQCVANVYVHDSQQEHNLLKNYLEIESARPKARHIIHYAELDEESGSHKRYVVVPHERRDKTKEAMMHSQVIHPHPGIWPSQIQIRKNGGVYTNGTGVGYIRLARAIIELGQDFWKERP